MRFFERKREAREHQYRDIEWPRQTKWIEELAQEGGTPLNHWFAQGKPMLAETVLQHICALERRIATLEEDK
jgi:hypothetical protein